MNVKTLTSSVPVGVAEVTDFYSYFRINSAENVRAMGWQRFYLFRNDRVSLLMKTSIKDIQVHYIKKYCIQRFTIQHKDASMSRRDRHMKYILLDNSGWKA